MIEEGIFTYLSTYEPLVQLQADRVYPDSLPQDPTVPATVFLSLSDPEDYSHSGVTGYKEQRFQFDCWDTEPMGAIRLKNTLRQALGGFKGMMGDTEVYAAFVEGGRALDDDGTGLFRRIVEVLFLYKEA